jgi:hypothetical protein
MEHSWNDNGRKKPKYAEENLFLRRQFVHHKSHVKKPGAETKPLAQITARKGRLRDWYLPKSLY